MPYELRLKIYTNPSLAKGNVLVPLDPVSGDVSNLLHVHPDDYITIMRLIRDYFKQPLAERKPPLQVKTDQDYR